MTADLGQQHLVEPEPTRAVKAPPGAAHFGVDPSTLRLAVGWSTATGELGAATHSYIRADGPRRLASIYRDTHTFITALADRVWPGFVLFEQPSGKTPNPNLVYACGVIQAAVYAALHNRAMREGWPAPEVELITSASWKKRACGRGDLYKPHREKGQPPPVFEDYPVAVWARANGYTGQSWDEADALGLAVAARRTVRFES